MFALNPHTGRQIKVGGRVWSGIASAQARLEQERLVDHVEHSHRAAGYAAFAPSQWARVGGFCGPCHAAPSFSAPQQWAADGESRDAGAGFYRHFLAARDSRSVRKEQKARRAKRAPKTRRTPGKPHIKPVRKLIVRNRPIGSDAPPWSAKGFKIGHVEDYNGRKFEIRRRGVTRYWQKIGG